MKLRSLLRILDLDEPTFAESMVSFLLWMANYYHAPPGEVFRIAHPAGTNEKVRQVSLSVRKQVKNYQSNSRASSHRAVVGVSAESGGTAAHQRLYPGHPTIQLFENGLRWVFSNGRRSKWHCGSKRVRSISGHKNP